MPLETRISIAKPADLPYVDALQRRFRHALGFLTFQALEGYLERGQVLLAFENAQPAGYLLWQRPTYPFGDETVRVCRIIQAAIDYDAQRRLHGTRLVHRLYQQVARATPTYLSCWCAEDLDANAFWAAVGFHHDATRDLRLAHRLLRTHNHWTRRPP